jgi:Amylo-alpha-1,6-glucosidase
LSRDGAYHQRTVWPWLLGAFFSSKLPSANSPILCLVKSINGSKSLKHIFAMQELAKFPKSLTETNVIVPADLRPSLECR